MLSRLSVRNTMLGVALFCALVFGYALYLQHGLGLTPCPMCIVQRYCFTAVALLALLTAWAKRGLMAKVLMFGVMVFAGLGAFTAARQSWLQWYPPEFASCGRDFYGMIEAFEWNRYVPMIFKGSGDCAAIDWTLFGLTIANYAFMAFIGIALLTWINVKRA